MMFFKPELFYQPSVQPDILGNPDSFADLRIGSDELIDRLYEPLRLKYPDYIRRENIGKDTSGEYDMWMYDFHPEHYRTTVYLQSGVHPIETEGYFGLARIMAMIAHGELSELRDSVRFIVIPAVSVYGISQKSKADKIEKNYKILHNCLGINSNRDCFEQSLNETRNVLSVISNFKNEIRFGFDLHTTTTETWGDYLTVFPDRLPHKKLIEETNAFLRKRNITWRKENLVYCGTSSNYPTGSNRSSFASYITEQMNVPVCTLEHSDFIFDSRLGTQRAMTRAVELYLNHIIQTLYFYTGGTRPL